MEQQQTASGEQHMPVEQIAALWNALPLATDAQSVVAFVRAVEYFHGIGTSAAPSESTYVWIRTAEQLPPVGQEVLVWCDGPLGGGAMLDCWDEQREALVDFSTITTPVGYGWNSGSTFEQVSHWMAFNEPQPACSHCNDKGWIDEGDPEIGSAIFACEKCPAAAVPAAPVPGVQAVDMAGELRKPRGQVSAEIRAAAWDLMRADTESMEVQSARSWNLSRLDEFIARASSGKA